MSKFKLSHNDMEIIKESEGRFSHIFRTIEEVKKFNVGDYLVRRLTNAAGKYETNSYGIPIKWIVVHVDSNGIPYVKKTAKSSKTEGSILPLVNLEDIIYNDDEYGLYHYELDPEYADAVIMQQEENYDPNHLSRNKADLFKEITAYNKSIRRKNTTITDAADIIRGLKVGDTIWFSGVTSFLVQSVHPIPVKLTGAVLKRDVMLEGTTNKGKKLTFSIYSFCRKSVYSNCPRSYRELKAL